MAAITGAGEIEDRGEARDVVEEHDSARGLGNRQGLTRERRALDGAQRRIRSAVVDRLVLQGSDSGRAPDRLVVHIDVADLRVLGRPGVHQGIHEGRPSPGQALRVGDAARAARATPFEPPRRGAVPHDDEHEDDDHGDRDEGPRPMLLRQVGAIRDVARPARPGNGNWNGMESHWWPGEREHSWTAALSVPQRRGPRRSTAPWPARNRPTPFHQRGTSNHRYRRFLARLRRPSVSP